MCLHKLQDCRYVEIDHEIIYTVILLIPLIQEGQLSVTGENMCISRRTEPAQEKCEQVN